MKSPGINGLTKLAWLPCAALCLIPTAAQATTLSCTDPSLVNPVYGIGGSAQTPLIAAIATTLAAQTPPITVIYASPGACNGINTLLSASDSFTTSANYWTAAGTIETCTPPATGVGADFAVMGVFADSCSGVTQSAVTAANIGSVAGPVLAWDLVVPGGASGSSQVSISAEAAYFVFGFGAATSQPAVSPWTLPSEIFIRSSTSAAQVALGLALGIPAASIQGTVANPNSNSGTISNVANAATPADAIGFVSSDVADANRTKVTTLAYQHFGQTCGYWPDSTVTAFDKINVRSGQYYLWSQSNIFTFVDSSGQPISNPSNVGTTANPGAVAELLTFFEPTSQTVSSLTSVVKTGNIPLCAMNASRATDLGPIVSYQPTSPCNGLFEKVATGTTTHTVCTAGDGTTDPAECSAADPVCRFGYCEVQ